MRTAAAARRAFSSFSVRLSSSSRSGPSGSASWWSPSTRWRSAALHASTSSSSSPASGLELELDGYGADALLVDEVIVSARGGRGGDGEAQQRGKGRTVRNFKYSSGRNLRKRIFLRAGAPTDGGDGGDVVCVCDTSMKDLGHIQRDITPPSTSSAVHASQATRGRRPGRVKSPQADAVVAYNGVKGAAADLSLSLIATRRQHRMDKARDCELRVPPGTVVMRTKGGGVIGECLNEGDRVTIARGGRGGLGVREPPERREGGGGHRRRRGGGGGGGGGYDDDERAHAYDGGRRRGGGAGSDVLADDKWHLEAKGSDGEHVTVRLVLRMMIDVGLVGLPNAGKSSLLRAMTRAAPKVAPYPFTTLAPSLGVLVARTDGESAMATEGEEGGDEIEELRFRDDSDAGATVVGRSDGGDATVVSSSEYDAAMERQHEVEEVVAAEAEEHEGDGDEGASGRPLPLESAEDVKPVIGDLPGLIEGAHVGRGLGRVFLKHIRRARVLCYVLDMTNVADDDGSGQSPARDFACLYEELRMYNPEYVRRPAIIVLNKQDVVLANRERGAAAVHALVAALEGAAREKYGGSDDVPVPEVLTTSALTGAGTTRLAEAATQLLSGSAAARATKAS